MRRHNAISDPVLSEEHRLLRDETRRFVDEVVWPEASERDPRGERTSDDLIDRLAERGFFGILIDEEYGGIGLDLTPYAVLAEDLARGLLSVAGIIVRGRGIAGLTDEHRVEYLPRMARGEYLESIAINEPDAGSDVANMSTRAPPRRRRVPHRRAEDADDRGEGLRRDLDVRAHRPGRRAPPPRHLRVPRREPRGTFDHEGLRDQPIDTIGYQGWWTWQVHFDCVRVPVERLVGRTSQEVSTLQRCSRILRSPRWKPPM